MRVNSKNKKGNVPSALRALEAKCLRTTQVRINERRLKNTKGNVPFATCAPVESQRPGAYAGGARETFRRRAAATTT